MQENPFYVHFRSYSITYLNENCAHVSTCIYVTSTYDYQILQAILNYYCILGILGHPWMLYRPKQAHSKQRVCSPAIQEDTTTAAVLLQSCATEQTV